MKALLLDMWFGGTDTLASTLEWVMSEMLRNPGVIKRMQEEMDLVVGKNK